MKKVEEGRSHRVISPMMLFNNNKSEITILLNQIAEENNITIGEAASALAEALKKFMTL